MVGIDGHHLSLKMLELHNPLKEKNLWDWFAYECFLEGVTLAKFLDLGGMWYGASYATQRLLHVIFSFFLFHDIDRKIERLQWATEDLSFAAIG